MTKPMSVFTALNASVLLTAIPAFSMIRLLIWG
jgi:hypothetical protein